ncbi:MAG: crotonase/enoyl-CoA hydratase family protein [Phenylobacterium sp.]|uniref:crotonase/enoyl-CoA hydratase family protein n=1 Tax=Phenylobacterium sp. TaxID=1871053 RepID=UPI0025E6594C|nr:crotonase/enoyl-CoA hydratase family protein [Phenylobacterium sp.]MCA3705044.1 crotonase/enoyl-CoA hydratase family protein [Methylobacterium sp.]MCA6251827.1 crotonase/enoyl-CoA hydratase family protein [Phenylobacterium sp.]MCA6259018.1 crotonase/enoyl-CoA hydratase family protein [Phenylobacterium sp.]MCA6301194.1 crotonase/enoyl-CoA hydratase family protein [Phenylobacterium sp.]
MDDGHIFQTVDGQVLRIGIARPEKRNSLTPPMMRGLADAFDRLQAEPELRVGVLYGEGGNFTSGLDLMKFVPIMSGAETAPVYEGFDPLQLKARLTKPLIAAVSGFVFTVGIELMLACDIVVAAEDCVFGQLETSRGIMVSGGGTVRWVQQVGWGNAMRHLLTAEKFYAAEALRIGLVQEVVETGSELERAAAIAKAVARNAPLAVQATKASALRYLADGERAAFDALAAAQAELARSADAIEGAAAMMQRRDPEFKGQ